jgi:hypothetical protein
MMPNKRCSTQAGLKLKGPSPRDALHGKIEIVHIALGQRSLRQRAIYSIESYDDIASDQSAQDLYKRTQAEPK